MFWSSLVRTKYCWTLLVLSLVLLAPSSHAQCHWYVVDKKNDFWHMNFRCKFAVFFIFIENLRHALIWGRNKGWDPTTWLDSACQKHNNWHLPSGSKKNIHRAKTQCEGRRNDLILRGKLKYSFVSAWQNLKSASYGAQRQKTWNTNSTDWQAQIGAHVYELVRKYLAMAVRSTEKLGQTALQPWYNSAIKIGSLLCYIEISRHQNLAAVMHEHFRGGQFLVQ